MHEKILQLALTCIGEHREFDFTSASTAEDAHVKETKESRARRGAKEVEDDPHVVDALKTVQKPASKP